MDATQSEEWRPVLGFEGSYEVSDQGRVRSLDRHVSGKGGSRRRLKGKLLTAVPVPGAYPLVTLSGGHRGNHRVLPIHRIVLAAFIGPRPADMEGCHNNGDREDNRLTNLRYGTRSDNMRDKRRHGTNWHVNKTHCKNGHEFTPENTYLRPDGTGRHCQQCRREANIRHRNRRATS